MMKKWFIYGKYLSTDAKLAFIYLHRYSICSNCRKS